MEASPNSYSSLTTDPLGAAGTLQLVARPGDCHTRSSLGSAARIVNRQQHHNNNTMTTGSHASGSAHIGSAIPQRPRVFQRLRGFRDAMPLLAPAAFGSELLVVFVGDILEVIGIGRIGLLPGNIRPARRVLTVELEPPLSGRLAIGNDRLDR